MPRRGDQWLIYALGGGWGHLSRAVALARAAESRHRVRILTNSPYAARIARVIPELNIVALDSSLGAQATRQRVRDEIGAAQPDCLIVDTFPRGLGGELVAVFETLQAAKVLVHRDLSPRYVRAAGLREFVRTRYRLVLIPGETEAGAFADLPAAVVTRPWLVRDPRSMVMPGKRILVCASGNPEELSWYGAVVECLLKRDPILDVRCVAPACPPACPPPLWINHWPAMDLYSESGVVIGSAGYNTIHECEACHVPLIARPWPRLYDRQWLRARRAAKQRRVIIVKTPSEAAEAAVGELKRERSPTAREFHNGARDAVALIEQVTN
jgi:hypothetical protein